MLMKPHNKSGLLITFCGLDGCGKTTIIQMLKNTLEDMGYPVILTKQPTNAVRESTIFRTFMDSPNHDDFDYRALSLLAASDRVQHSNRFILPKLEEGNIVISDRYFYSCLANLRARGYKEDKWIEEVAGFIPKPDLSIFLDVDVPLAIKRVRSRAIEKDRYIDIPLQYNLRNEYINICKKFGGNFYNSAGESHYTFEKIMKEVYPILYQQTIPSKALWKLESRTI